MNAWEVKQKIGTWALVLMFFMLMLPFGKIVENIKEKQALVKVAEENSENILNQAKAALAIAQGHQKLNNYTYLQYAQDVKDLREASQQVDLLDFKNPTESSVIKTQADSTIENCFNHLKSLQPAEAQFQIGHEIQEAFVQVGLIPRDGLPAGTIWSAIVTIAKWYAIFMIFALAIFMVRLYYNPSYSLKEELILGLPRLLKFSAAWPIGLPTFPIDNNPHGGYSIKQRTAFEEKLRYLCLKLGKFEHQLSEDDLNKLREKAYGPVKAVDRAIATVEHMPAAVKEKGRMATMVTSLLTTLLSPVISRADELLQYILTGSGSGNNVTLKYSHGEEYWQGNATYSNGGAGISLLAGPKLEALNFKFKGSQVKMTPEAGVVVATSPALGIDTALVGVNAVMPATIQWPWNAWSLNRFSINFKEKLMDMFSFETALHYMLFEKLGLGVGVSGLVPLFAKTPVTGNFGPRIFWKASTSIMVEAALGFDFQTLLPSTFRILAFIPF